MRLLIDERVVLGQRGRLLPPGGRRSTGHPDMLAAVNAPGLGYGWPVVHYSDLTAPRPAR